MSYVAMLKELHRSRGWTSTWPGDFLVMAATLMEIKSAMLLPKPPPEQRPTETDGGAGTDRPAL